MEEIKRTIWKGDSEVIGIPINNTSKTGHNERKFYQEVNGQNMKKIEQPDTNETKHFWDK